MDGEGSCLGLLRGKWMEDCGVVCCRAGDEIFAACSGLGTWLLEVL